MSDHDALLRAVIESPDDDTPRLVMADWYQEHGDPDRAEFIRLQVEWSRTGGEPTAREQDLLVARGMGWLEPFADFIPDAWAPDDAWYYDRGFVGRLTVDTTESGYDPERLAGFFDLAPLRVLWFPYTQDFNEDLPPEVPLGRLSELWLEGSTLGIDSGIGDLFHSDRVVNLRTLVARGYDDNGHLDRQAVGSLADSDRFRSLRSLDLSGNWCNWMRSREKGWVADMMRAEFLPRLERLDLSGTSMEDAGVRAIAGCTRFNALRHLDLTGNTFTEAGLRELTESPWLDQLDSLGLTERESDWYDEEDGPTQETWARLRERLGPRLVLDD